VLSTAFYCLTT